MQFKLDTEVITDAILFVAKGLIHPWMMAPEVLDNAANTVGSTVTRGNFLLTEAKYLPSQYENFENRYYVIE